RSERCRCASAAHAGVRPRAVRPRPGGQRARRRVDGSDRCRMCTWRLSFLRGILISKDLRSKRIKGDILTSRDLCSTVGDVPKDDDRDHVDRFIDEIRDELPESVDLVVEGIVDRINGINWRLKRMLDETLEQYGLTSGDFKVMSALRWRTPHRRSAGEL